MLSELRALWDHHRQVLTSMDTPPTRSEHEVEQALSRLEDGAETWYCVDYGYGISPSACATTKDNAETLRTRDIGDRIVRVLVIRDGERDT